MDANARELKIDHNDTTAQRTPWRWLRRTKTYLSCPVENPSIPSFPRRRESSVAAVMVEHVAGFPPARE
jgi:hypothetical protein